MPESASSVTAKPIPATPTVPVDCGPATASATSATAAVAIATRPASAVRSARARPASLCVPAIG